jgi:hypothetical protein
MNRPHPTLSPAKQLPSVVKVFSPTDAQLDSLKNNFKFALKLTLKCPYMFRCAKHHHHQGSHYLSLAKVTVVKIS